MRCFLIHFAEQSGSVTPIAGSAATFLMSSSRRKRRRLLGFVGARSGSRPVTSARADLMTLDTLSPLTKFLRIGGRRPGSLQAVSRQLCPTSAEPRRGNHECAIAGAMIATRCTYALSLAWWGRRPGGPACVPLVISRRARRHDRPPVWRASPERLPSSQAHPGATRRTSGNFPATQRPLSRGSRAAQDLRAFAYARRSRPGVARRDRSWLCTLE